MLSNDALATKELAILDRPAYGVSEAAACWACGTRRERGLTATSDLACATRR